jgi:hypothetical protein
MFNTAHQAAAVEFRAQLTELDTPAAESCIAQTIAGASTLSRAGLCYNTHSLDALSPSNRIAIAQEVLAERLATVAAMVQSAFHSAEEAREAEAHAEAAFEVTLATFQTQAEDEEIARLALELAEVEAATAELRRAWEWGFRAQGATPQPNAEAGDSQ